MLILETQDVLLILFYRSIGLSLMVLLFTCLRRNQSVNSFFRSLDVRDFIIGIFLSISFCGYVFSIIHSSVASTLFILSSGPFFTAVISLVWINERPNLVTWTTMIIAIVGMMIMLLNGLETGKILGNIGALITTISFSSMLVYIRKNKKTDVLGGTFLGGFLCCVFVLFIVVFIKKSLLLSFQDTCIIFGMGALTIGLGISLITSSAPYLSAPEVSIFMLAESILGPLWPWFFLGEKIKTMELIGGALILLSLFILFIFGNDRKHLIKS